MIPGIVAGASQGSGAGATERWWRVRFPVPNNGSSTMTSNNPFIDIKFIAMATTNGGANIVPDYIDSKSSIGSHLNAVVDNTSLWNNAGIGPLAVDMWAAFKLPTADDINEVKVRCGSTSSYSPFVVCVDSSYDGVNWTFEFGHARLGWGSSELKTFQRSYLGFANVVPSTRWLMQPYKTTGRSNLGTFEMEMAETAGGADICTGGSPLAQANGTFPPANLTDNNIASLSGSTSVARLSYNGYDFGAGNTKTLEEIRILQSVNGEQPDFGAVCAVTPDNGAWAVIQEFYGIPNQGGAASTITMKATGDVKAGDTSAHRYWRVRAGKKGTLGNGYVYSCAKLDFRASGSTLIGSGTPISSTENSGSFIDDYAFDGNTATLWASNGNDMTFQWVGYDFGSAVLPDQVVLQARDDATAWNQTFSIITVEWSDDGKLWYEKETFEVTEITGALDEQTFALAA